MRRLSLFVLLGLLVATPAAAQVVNPNVLQFTPSPDHALIVAGAPVIDRYVFEVTLSTNIGQISVSKDLGKPDPDATNTISVTVSADLATLPNGSYVATVSAVGPGGSGKSDPSSPFARVGPPAKPGPPALKK